MRALTRFRLRGLLLFVALCAMGLAWCAARVRQCDTQKRALDRIERIVDYGPITRMGTWETCSATAGSFDAHPSVPRWLEAPLQLCGWDVPQRVVKLHLSGHRIDDRIVQYVEKLTSLERLRLWQTQVTEEGLRRLEDALPHTRIEFVGVRDVEIRSPMHGKILYVAQDGAPVEQADALLTLASETKGRYTIRTTHDGTLRYPERRYPNNTQTRAGETVREREIILIIQPVDSLTSI